MKQAPLGKKWEEQTDSVKLSEILTEYCLILFAKFTDTVGLSATLHTTMSHCVY